MSNRAGRAGIYALVSLLGLTVISDALVPLVGFALVAIGAAGLRHGRVFELLADPAERRRGRLHGLLEFSIAGMVLAIATWINLIPNAIFAGTVVLIGGGQLGVVLARWARPDRLSETIGFITAGFIGYVIGHAGVYGFDQVDPTLMGFLAMAGALAGALGRVMSWSRRDGLVMIILGPLLAGLATLPAPTLSTLSIGIAVSVVLAYLALWIGAASIPGLVTGVLLIFLTIVLGGLDWVAMLVAFFVIGGLSTKYRYDQKRVRGVAEPNRGERGSGNVLGNTAVAMLAVVGFAATANGTTWETVFLFAYAGSLATALSDTLSSEIGGLFDDPLLITSLDRVRPGTDGAITWQGEIAGFVGSSIIAILFVVLGPAGVLGGAIVAVAGFFGMHVDSILGAAFEGRMVGNHAVNAMATLAGAIVAVVPALIWL